MKGIQGSLKFYMVRKCWLVQPFVELSVWETLFWELFGFPQNSKHIPLPQPKNFLLLVYGGVHKNLKFLVNISSFGLLS
jgi:hypothetical protein